MVSKIQPFTQARRRVASDWRLGQLSASRPAVSLVGPPRHESLLAAGAQNP